MTHAGNIKIDAITYTIIKIRNMISMHAGLAIFSIILSFCNFVEPGSDDTIDQVYL